MHGASDYALDLVGERQMLAKVLLERAALLPTQVRKLRVGDVIFLCRTSGKMHSETPQRSRRALMIDVVQCLAMSDQDDGGRHCF